MKLKEIFDQLTFGELAQMEMGGARIGEVTENNYQKLGVPTGLGLTALHKRFLLREGTAIITPVPGMLTYVLDSKYAVSNTYSQETTKYLTDTVDAPFEDNVLKIERVYDADDKELILNDRSEKTSLFTPHFRTLVIPADLDSATLRVVFRANHPLLTDFHWDDPESAEIDLPHSHLEALLYFVASRVLNPVGFASGNGFHEGNNYLAKFEAECVLLEAQALRVDDGTQSTKLTDRGWV